MSAEAAGGGAAAVEGVALGFRAALVAVVDGLQGCTQQRVDQREDGRQGESSPEHAWCVAVGHPSAQQDPGDAAEDDQRHQEKGEEERLLEARNAVNLLDWSRDGRYLLYAEQNAETGSDLMVLPLFVSGVR